MLHESALTASQARRMARCGAPVVYHRLSGASFKTSFCCGVRWCPDCSWKHQLRVHSCIAQSVGALERTEDGAYQRVPGGRAWMVTLTQPAPRGLSESKLERALHLQQTLWRETASRLRWWAHRAKRGDIDAAAELQPPRLTTGAPHPEYSKTWDSELGDWAAPSESDGYVWALELTTGAKADRWHLHRHVVCPSLAVAERINAGWQAAVASLDIPGHGWASTSIDEVSGYYAAWYLAGYVTGKDETVEVPTHKHAAYRRVMSGAQRYNAGGANRPLGIARPPSEDPVVAVELPGYAARGRDCVFEAAEFFSGVAGCWSGPTKGDDWAPEGDPYAVFYDRLTDHLEPSSPVVDDSHPSWGKHPEARAP